jgi:hypothetical protein
MTDSTSVGRVGVALSERAETLEDMIRISIENGLFARDDKDVEALIDAVLQARERIAAGEVDDAASALTKGEHVLHRSLYRPKNYVWRWIHVHQMPLLAYYVVILFCALNVGSGYWAFVAKDIWSLPVAALGLGTLGAVLRGLWWLQRNVGRRSFRMSFTLAYLAAPWIGALFGLFTYLLLLAGVVSLEGPEGADLNGKVLPLALAFLAGYSWEWVLDRVDRLRGRTGNNHPSSPAASRSTSETQTQGTRGEVTDDEPRATRKVEDPD